LVHDFQCIMKPAVNEVSPGVSRRSAVSQFGFNERFGKYVSPVYSCNAPVAAPSVGPSTSATLSNPKDSLLSAFCAFESSGDPKGPVV